MSYNRLPHLRLFQKEHATTKVLSCVSFLDTSHVLLILVKTKYLEVVKFWDVFLKNNVAPKKMACSRTRVKCIKTKDVEVSGEADASVETQYTFGQSPEQDKQTFFVKQTYNCKRSIQQCISLTCS